MKILHMTFEFNGYTKTYGFYIDEENEKEYVGLLPENHMLIMDNMMNVAMQELASGLAPYLLAKKIVEISHLSKE